MQLDSYSIKATRDGLRHHCDDVLVPAGAEPVIQMPLVLHGSIGTMNSTGSSSVASAGATVPLVCKSRHCSVP